MLQTVSITLIEQCKTCSWGAHQRAEGALRWVRPDRGVAGDAADLSVPLVRGGVAGVRSSFVITALPLCSEYTYTGALPRSCKQTQPTHQTVQSR